MAILKYPHIAEGKYKKTIDTLRKIGVINYTSGIKLSRAQDFNLRKKADEYAQLLKHPEQFAIKKVSKATAKELRDSGLKTTKSMRAIIPLKGFDKATIKNGGIVFEGKTKQGQKIKETVTLIGGGNFEAKIKRLSKTKLKKNQALKIKIGDNAVNNHEFQNLADLTKYVNAIKFNLGRGQDREGILRIISIVEIESAGFAKKKKAKNAAQRKTKK